MQEILLRKLHSYISDNNPDLLLVLMEENKLDDYLRKSVSSVETLISQLLAENKGTPFIEETCMEELTRQLRPSRFQYLKTILEEEFPKDYSRLYEHGLLATEIINLIASCDPVFDDLNFSEQNENDRNIHSAITGAVYEYFNKVVNGN